MATNTFKIGQESLSNFAASVGFDNPRAAALMQSDILTVAMWAMSADKTEGQAAATRLRRTVSEQNLAEIHRRVLETALDHLGYD